MKIGDPREFLATTARERGISLLRLSVLLGRNQAYLQQFVKRGTPVRLTERDRRVLSQFLGVDEVHLGGSPDASARTVSVPRLDVRASAGPGAFSTGERKVSEVNFDLDWLKQICRGRAQDISIIRVDGDSMVPTLAHDDDLLVDKADGQSDLRDGVYVLRRDDVLSVKRLSVNPADGTLTIASDNPAHPTWHNCPPDTIDIIGRVVWMSRKLT